MRRSSRPPRGRYDEPAPQSRAPPQRVARSGPSPVRELIAHHARLPLPGSPHALNDGFGAIRRIRVSPEYRLVSVDSGRSIDMGRGGRLEPQQSPTAVYAGSASSAFASFRSAVSKPSVKPARTLEAHSVERKPAAIFAADVEGYSRLMGRDEARAARRLPNFQSDWGLYDSPLEETGFEPSIPHAAISL